MVWRIALLALLIVGLIVAAKQRREAFAVNESENALCKSFTTQSECEAASTECAWCPSQAPQCVMVGCCSEPGKGGLYKTTSECTEESKNLRGSVVAAAAAAAPALRNTIDANIALKAGSVFLNGRPTTTAAVTQPSTRLPLPAAVQAVAKPATPATAAKPAFQSAAPVPVPRPIPQSTLPATASPVAQQAVSRPSPTLSTPSMSVSAAPVSAQTSTPVAASVAAPAAITASAASAPAPSSLPAGAMAAMSRKAGK